MQPYRHIDVVATWVAADPPIASPSNLAYDAVIGMADIHRFLCWELIYGPRQPSDPGSSCCPILQ